MHQPVMTLMFEARIDAMATELSKMQPGELDTDGLLRLHTQTCRLLRPPRPVEHTCIKDDGGTPNRRCDACEAER